MAIRASRRRGKASVMDRRPNPGVREPDNGQTSQGPSPSAVDTPSGLPSIRWREATREPGSTPHGFCECPDPPVPLSTRRSLRAVQMGWMRAMLHRRPSRGTIRTGPCAWWAPPTASMPARAPGNRLAPHPQRLALADRHDFRRKETTAVVRQFDRIPRPRPQNLPQVAGFLRPELMGTRRDIGGIEPAHETKKKRRKARLTLRRFVHSQPVVNSPPRWTPVPPPGRPRSRPTRIARN